MKLDALFKSLKALPQYAFALMIGASFVMSVFAVAFISILYFRKWSEAVEPIIVTGFVTALYIALAALILVIITLAFGKLDSLKISGPTVSAELDFEDHNE